MSKPKAIVKTLFNLGGIDVKKYNKSLALYQSLFEKYKTFTMIPKQLFVSNLALCDQFRQLEGDYVECGVWRGGMSAAISEVLRRKNTMHLFDSFEGLPPAKEIDGKEAIAWQKDINAPGYFDNCSADESFAIQAMALAGNKNYKIYKGWFNQTLPDFKNQAIAILRLDGDWYDSIIECLNNLFPQVINGGIVIIDDYYAWDGCAKAVHDYLSETKSASRLHQWDNQIAYILKKE
jgi:O-methyltransferase